MHYQLFIPTEQGQPHGSPQQALERLGLGDLIPNHEGRQSQGPEDQQGTLFAWRKPGANEFFHFNADEQTWVPALPQNPEGEGKGRYWVGFWNEHPVQPDDIKRPQADWGTTVELGDGQQWVVPTVQSFTRDIVRQADTGNWHTPLQVKYQEAFFAAKSWWVRLKSMNEEEVPWGELAAYVESVLLLNYRLLPEVTDYLRLLNTENITVAMLSIIGVALAQEMEDEQQR